MFNIMIVDDEPMNRHGLVNFIEWATMDCKISGEASDGIEALEVIEQVIPDIIIADIKMPGIDGIQLAQHIYENYPAIKVILLTGYSEFQYAQSAIKYGVVDFILKPSSTEKIIEAVTKAKKLILSDREKDDRLQSLQNELSENIDQMREKFLLDYINGVIFEQDMILRKMEQLHINIGSCYALVFEFDKLRHTTDGQHKTKKANSILEMKNFLSMVFKDYEHYTISISGNILCSIISFTQNKATDSSTYIQSRCEEIIEFMRTFTSITMFIGVSDYHNNCLEIPMAFKEANASLSYKFYNENRILRYLDFKNTKTSLEEIDVTGFMDSILVSLKDGNADKAVNSMIELFDKERNSFQSIEHIHSSGIMITSLCSSLLSNYNTTLKDVMDESENINGQIASSETFEKLTSLLEMIIRRVSEFLNSMNAKSNYIVKSTLDYIGDNYNKPIKLKDIADYVHVNSSYLSRLIRKETGETLTEVITKFRVEKANELLVSQKIRAYEVAEMVGIEDTAYFSYLFKKYTGKSPTEFKYTGK